MKLKNRDFEAGPFIRLGKPAKIASYFGGKQGYLKAVEELEQGDLCGRGSVSYERFRNEIGFLYAGIGQTLYHPCVSKKL